MSNVLVSVSFLLTVFATTLHGRLSLYNPKIRTHLPREYSYETLYITQKVDHLGFKNGDTFKLRYLVANQFWNHDGGPIFFYTGNEGDISWFCNNTGFMWDIAPEFKALLIFAEHRYYGTSLPYGAASFANATMLNYLSAEQALADFAVLIQFLKETIPGASNSPVIVFGGSYGGMLSSWIRFKYPNLVDGALAASAPIWQFQDLVPCNTFYTVLQSTFESTSKQCVENLGRTWDTLSDLFQAESYQFLTQTFSLCTPVKTMSDLANMKSWILGVLENLGMVDYPYPASFLEPLPAWPIKEFCKYLSVPLTSKDLLVAVSQGLKMYFNYTGQSPCLNMSQQATGDLGDLGWDYQACTEMVMPKCSNNVGMVFNSPWDFANYSQQCKQRWGVIPKEYWVVTEFWGKHIKTASNIIFSNGLLDPWSGGGVLASLSPSLIAIQIPMGAHHLDLRAAHSGDTPDVIAARKQEINIIKNWLYGQK